MKLTPRPCGHLWEKAALLLRKWGFPQSSALLQWKTCSAHPKHSRHLLFFCLVFLFFTCLVLLAFFSKQGHTHAHTMLTQGHCRKPKIPSDQKEQ